jgi:nucleotide-binding universal stress UspA family protein
VRTIVVGVDGPERSEDALALARRLAARTSRLLLVCAYPADPVLAGDGGATYVRALQADAEATLARLGGEIGSETLAIADRHPAHALLKVASDVDAPLVVVGSSHAGPLRRVLPGSTGAHLLHGAPCAVAIAPARFAEHDDEPFGLVACAYDGTPEARRALELAVSVASGVGAQLRVMRVLEPLGPVDATLAINPQSAAAARRLREQPLNDLRQVVAELHPMAEGVALCGDAAEELVRASFAADLMVFGSRGYGPLRGVLLGSVSQRVIRSAGCPVVVVPRTAQRSADDDGELVRASVSA